MRDHSLSPGLRTQAAWHRHTYTCTHVKVMEGDAWLWKCKGTDRDFECSYPSRTLFLLIDSALLIMSMHAGAHICSCMHACLLMSIRTFINPVCALSIAGYELWWEVFGVESSREERSLSNSTLQYQLTGLTTTTKYALQVAALTAAGRGVVTSSTISTGVPPGTIDTHSNTHKPERGKLSSLCVCALMGCWCVRDRVNMTDELLQCHCLSSGW